MFNSSEEISETSQISLRRETYNLDLSEVIERHSPVESCPITVPVEVSKTSIKKNFCLFCNLLFTKLPQHMERAHKDEKEVQEFIMLPKGN